MDSNNTSMFSNHCEIKLESNSKLVIVPAMWMKINCLMLSGRSKAQKTMCCMVPLIWHSGTISTKIWPVFARTHLEWAWFQRNWWEFSGVMKLFFLSFCLCIFYILWLPHDCVHLSKNRLYTKNYKFAVYKLYLNFKNERMSIAFIYTNWRYNEWKISFTIVKKKKKIKYLGTNLTNILCKKTIHTL